jgi:hypothetical protein
MRANLEPLARRWALRLNRAAGCLLLGTALLLIALAFLSTDERHGGAYLFVGGLALLSVSAALLVAAWALGRSRRLGWRAQLLPLAAIGALLWLANIRP